MHSQVTDLLPSPLAGEGLGMRGKYPLQREEK